MTLARDERAQMEGTLQRILDRMCLPGQRRARLARGEGFRRDTWATLADAGVLSLPFGEADGGLNGSLIDVMSVTRALGQSLAPEPYLQCVVVAGRLLETAGDQALRQAWLPRLIAGECLFGLAHFERGENSSGEVRKTTLSSSGDRHRLNGSKLHVPLARELEMFIVTACDAAGRLRLCLVPSNSPGIDVRSYRLVDGQLAGEVTFNDVAVPATAQIVTDSLESKLESVLSYASAAAAADTVGCMRRLLELTVEYDNTRKQFGQPISRFQVVKHRLVDCYTSLEQAEGMLETAAQEENPRWQANVAAAKAFIDHCAVRVGHAAIQLHGAMGVTDELAVGHYHKRLLANAFLYGEPRSQIRQFVQRFPVADAGAESSALYFPQLLCTEDLTFRDEVRAFLSKELTPELKHAARLMTGTFPEKEVAVEWQKRLGERGWLAPLWPPESGGTGWTAVQRFLFEYECAVAGAPERIPMGFRYVGPVVAYFGTAWQKSWFLPRLLSGEHYWAQGFSEPGAGSDLASLETTAVLDGDQYVVNGTKIWTTHAHYANWIFCLVRTAKSEKRQEGISFLLVEIDSPGVKVEPIQLLAGDHEVCQVFFDDVKVPQRNLVGEPGRGWEYAKFLLELERGGSAFSGRRRFELNAVKELVAKQRSHLLQDPAFVEQLAALEHRVMALEMLEFRLAQAMTDASAPGVGSSVSKLVSSELRQDITEMAISVAGLEGLELTMPQLLSDRGATDHPGLDLELVAMPRYLSARATTIYGGSSEVQREIIGKHVLGLRS